MPRMQKNVKKPKKVLYVRFMVVVKREVKKVSKYCFITAASYSFILARASSVSELQGARKQWDPLLHAVC